MCFVYYELRPALLCLLFCFFAALLSSQGSGRAENPPQDPPITPLRDYSRLLSPRRRVGENGPSTLPREDSCCPSEVSFTSGVCVLYIRLAPKSLTMCFKVKFDLLFTPEEGVSSVVVDKLTIQLRFFRHFKPCKLMPCTAVATTQQNTNACGMKRWRFFRRPRLRWCFGVGSCPAYRYIPA